MAYSNKLLGPIQIAANDKPAESAAQLADLMADADYLRQSSALINEALQKGFDVLQLANGDIVTTGTKTIVNTFVWDGSKGRLAKQKTTEKRTRKTKEEKFDFALDEEA